MRCGSWADGLNTIIAKRLGTRARKKPGKPRERESKTKIL